MVTLALLLLLTSILAYSEGRVAGSRLASRLFALFVGFEERERQWGKRRPWGRVHMMRSGKRGGDYCCENVWIGEDKTESEDTKQEREEFDEAYSDKEQDTSNFITNLSDSYLSSKTVLFEFPVTGKMRRSVGIPEGWGPYWMRSLVPAWRSYKQGNLWRRTPREVWEKNK